jgi:hypothetical protein
LNLWIQNPWIQRADKKEGKGEEEGKGEGGRGRGRERKTERERECQGLSQGSFRRFASKKPGLFVSEYDDVNLDSGKLHSSACKNNS